MLRTLETLTPNNGGGWRTSAAFCGACPGLLPCQIAQMRYRDFVRVHVRAMDMSDPAGMSWGVHSMGPMMRGRNFLAWHRHFVRRLEKRLRRVHPTIAIPYWDAINDRQLPPRLTGATLLSSWSVTRNWNPTLLPDP